MPTRREPDIVNKPPFIGSAVVAALFVAAIAVMIFKVSA